MIDTRLRSTGESLTRSQRKAYHRALGESHAMDISVHLLDSDEDTTKSLTTPVRRVLDGQVVVDTRNPISRSLTLSVLDPAHKLYLDPDSPRATALHPGQMVRVVRHDFVAALDDYVSCPVFWGPLTRFERAGNVVSIDAVGKESLMLEPRVMWGRALNFRKGLKVTTAIDRVLRAMGERRIDLPANLNRRLPNRLSVTRHDEGWRIAQRLARSVNRQLFYDGRGMARLRAFPKDPVFGFYAVELNTKPAPQVLTDPVFTYEFTELRNIVEVLGPEPAGRKRRVRAVARAPRRHPLGPWRMARDGSPAYMVETRENSKLKRRAGQAQRIADRILDDRLRIALDVQFESLPIPDLEERDLCTLRIEGDTVTFRLLSFTIPLTPEGTMSVGFIKRPDMRRRRGA